MNNIPRYGKTIKSQSIYTKKHKTHDRIRRTYNGKISRSRKPAF